MHGTLKHISQSLQFSQWSRKNYAIFASLGKEINIGHVDIEICEKASEKSAKQNPILINCIDSVQLDSDEEEDLSVKNIETELVTFLSITSNSDISSRHCCNSISNKSFSIIISHPEYRDASTYFNILRNDK